MRRVAISRTARISLLLFVDVMFFLAELIVGYIVGSLALVADSFHMLNDILSLVVALYAIKLSKRKVDETDTKYSYGFHRAEIVAALINGVFLLALCFSIFMEAIQRFFDTPKVSNPSLVVIVGSLGLASNILGLFLFHEHSHSHGHKNHSKETTTLSEELGQSEFTSALSSGSVSPTFDDERGRSEGRSDPDSLYGHPAATRVRIVHKAQELRRARSVSVSSSREGSPTAQRRVRTHTGFMHVDEPENDTVERDFSETTPLPKGPNGKEIPSPTSHHSHTHPSPSSQGAKRSGGHSHGSMNMHAILLHVLGDALGNVGVIASGLIIWLSNLSWKYYWDPIVSLVITCIIFSSALPLVKSASFILLQGVPSGISLREVDEAIRGVDGVQDVHELHIWQLSESNVVASVHVLASRKRDFMQVAADIRKALHDRGIYSSTIQPEYHSSRQLQSAGTSSPPLPPPGTCCLVTCSPNQKDCDPLEHSCCPPPAPKA
ncbi:cation efflux protein [Fomitiporia mediterranea MF3/22]|uniref:cation efflux protein n=1 Tax=Fomitiporia mediterranea (strain MF3/22) TaxID=694068 RepID=UPI0004407E69|nr:cation efflux protein [Fomitiporia mediterranea MF3/22]EJD03835.1 cation efflux protein [Fomitiporia mediterranea MF3/22]